MCNARTDLAPNAGQRQKPCCDAALRGLASENLRQLHRAATY
ncbi:hypothetical protein PATSB16_40730 [Pandoraea thiooxydans]|nr:hypothetical protein PATSB16_40730 [Pandoraea thiooxydans]